MASFFLFLFFGGFQHTQKIFRVSGFQHTQKSDVSVTDLLLNPDWLPTTVAEPLGKEKRPAAEQNPERVVSRSSTLEQEQESPPGATHRGGDTTRSSSSVGNHAGLQHQGREDGDAPSPGKERSPNLQTTKESVLELHSRRTRTTPSEAPLQIVSSSKTTGSSRELPKSPPAPSSPAPPDSALSGGAGAEIPPAPQPTAPRTPTGGAPATGPPQSRPLSFSPFHYQNPVIRLDEDEDLSSSSTGSSSARPFATLPPSRDEDIGGMIAEDTSEDSETTSEEALLSGGKTSRQSDVPGRAPAAISEDDSSTTRTDAGDLAQTFAEFVGRPTAADGKTTAGAVGRPTTVVSDGGDEQFAHLPRRKQPSDEQFAHMTDPVDRALDAIVDDPDVIAREEEVPRARDRGHDGLLSSSLETTLARAEKRARRGGEEAAGADGEEAAEEGSSAEGDHAKEAPAPADAAARDAAADSAGEGGGAPKTVAKAADSSTKELKPNPLVGDGHLPLSSFSILPPETANLAKDFSAIENEKKLEQNLKTEAQKRNSVSTKTKTVIQDWAESLRKAVYNRQCRTIMDLYTKSVLASGHRDFVWKVSKEANHNVRGRDCSREVPVWSSSCAGECLFETTLICI